MKKSVSPMMVAIAVVVLIVVVFAIYKMTLGKSGDAAPGEEGAVDEPPVEDAGAAVAPAGSDVGSGGGPGVAPIGPSG